MIQFNVFFVPTLLSFKVESYLSVFVFRIPYDGIPPLFLGMAWDFCWDPMDFGWDPRDLCWDPMDLCWDPNSISIFIHDVSSHSKLLSTAERLELDQTMCNKNMTK